VRLGSTAGASPAIRRGATSAARIANALAVHAAGLGDEIRVLEGAPLDHLAEQSRELDLLVVGSRGYGPLRRVLLGGVSGALLQTAACPVVVVPRRARER
jgi:nucleotide-binding universal stress UspA family protein